MFDCLKFRRRSLSPTTNAIQRFTYDWLIRFMELTPDNANPKLAMVSPLFNQCATKHATYYVWFGNANPANTYKPPVTKNKIICTGQAYFVNSVESIENTLDFSDQMAKFIHPRFYYYLTEITLINIPNVDFAVLQRLLTKSVKKFSVYYSKFTTQVYFSQLWPLISHCEHIRPYLENLIYDEDMTDLMIDSGPCEKLTYLKLLHTPKLKCFVYPIFDHILATSKRSLLSIDFYVPPDMYKTIKHKILMAGFTIHSSTFRTFEIQKTNRSFDDAFTFCVN